jgi:hypothetical protein
MVEPMAEMQWRNLIQTVSELKNAPVSLIRGVTVFKLMSFFLFFFSSLSATTDDDDDDDDNS